jgi:hypothetical protein
MNTGQMMLATGAMVLLGTTVFTVNRNNLQHGTILRQTELGIYAVSLGTSIIQRASGMSFDELTIGNSSVPTIPSPVTGVLSTALGRETGTANIIGPTEWANNDTSFDDFDDYNNFSRDTTITGVDNFHIIAFVYYVTQPTPAQPTPTYSLTPTWIKQMDIAVNNTISRKVFENASSTNKEGTDTIKMSYIFSFY